MDDRALLLAKIATMYYLDNLSQQEISNIVKISRPTVSRALMEAREKGIVEITIHSTIPRVYKLEQKIMEKYSLDEAVIVPVLSLQDDNILKSLGDAAAYYLYENAKDNMTIGFSMGKTLDQMANSLKNHSINKNINLNVVPIVGGAGYQAPHLHANDICRRVAEVFGGEFFPIYVPAIAENEKKKLDFMSEPLVNKVFEMSLNADIIFVSVGKVDSSTFLKIGSIDESETNNLIKQGIIGDIGSWFFDENGNFPNIEINKSIVGLNFSKLRKNSKVILVAGTEPKKEVIKSALKGGWVDTLITDEDVCKYLLQ